MLSKCLILYSIEDLRTILEVLKKKIISIHVRSIFLQGALLSNHKNRITESPEVKSFKKLVTQI